MGAACGLWRAHWQITSEILEAIKLAATQYLLGAHKLSSLQGTYYLCPATFLVLMVMFVCMELPVFIRNEGYLLVVGVPTHISLHLVTPVTGVTVLAVMLQ